MPKESDYVAARQGYVVGFNSRTHCPDWTMERLTASNLVNSAAGRSEDFREDLQIPTSAKLSDYKRSGWSRGHMTPAADCKWSYEAMSQTFLLTNMCPQDQRNNAGAWNRIEECVRGWAKRESSLIVFTGPIYDETKPPRFIGTSKVRIPDGFYKVVYDETPPTKMIAFIVDNADTKLKPRQLITTVDEVERRTGFDFFSKFPAAEQSRLESAADWEAWK